MAVAVAWVAVGEAMDAVETASAQAGAEPRTGWAAVEAAMAGVVWARKGAASARVAGEMAASRLVGTHAVRKPGRLSTPGKQRQVAAAARAESRSRTTCASACSAAFVDG